MAHHTILHRHHGLHRYHSSYYGGPLRIFVDSACPICRQQGDFFKWVDRSQGRIMVEDIASPHFAPERYGFPREQMMGQIHGVTWDGRWLHGMEVIREAYRIIGMGWLVNFTGWPILRPIFDQAYYAFARHRWRTSPRERHSPR